MRFRKDRNASNLLPVIIVLAVSVISCTSIKGLSGIFNKQSDKVNSFNYEIPTAFRNAELDPDINDKSKFTILIPASGQIMLGNVESTPIDMQTLGAQIEAFAADRSRNDQTVYIAASREADAGTLNQVLEQLRRAKIATIRLLVGDVERRRGVNGIESMYDKSMGDIPAPNKIFEVEIQYEVLDERPNPMMLVVSDCAKGSKVCLNNSTYDNTDKLGEKLIDIFRSREQNGVFRIGSNEVEKTVLLELDKPEMKYGRIVNIIDELYGAGADPIILIDSDTFANPVVRSLLDGPSITSQPGTSTIPKTISGGVLNGKAISLPKPEYPAAARAVRAAGVVSVQVTVDVDGNVVEAKAAGGHPLLQAAAETAARAAKFSPTLLAGEKVKVSGVIVYNFVP